MRRNIEHDLRGWKRNMQEEADPVRHALGTQRFGERDQVIVMSPDDVVRREQLDQLVREPCIDAPVTGVLFALITREIVAVVKDWPERRIREAAIVLVIVLARETGG